MENSEILEDMPTLIARRKLNYDHTDEPVYCGTAEGESTTFGKNETLMVYTSIVNIFSAMTGAHFKV